MSVFDWLCEIASVFIMNQTVEPESPSISQNIDRVRSLATRRLGKNVVNQGWLDQPLLDGLSPWQLVMNGQTQKVIIYLRNCPRV